MFYKLILLKILLIDICSKALTGIAISINKWAAIRYIEYKLRIVYKIEFEEIKQKKGLVKPQIKLSKKIRFRKFPVQFAQ